MLHSDIAMLVVPFSQSSVGCRKTSTVVAKDGLVVGAGCEGVHWTFARALLDGVEPSPSRNPTARLWVIATAVWLLENRDYTNAEAHVEHAQRWYPTDADVLFQHGYYHGAIAAAAVQAAAREAALTLPAAREQTAEAAELLGRALVSNPDLTEARVRRGHALNVLGRSQEASDELRRAQAGVQNTQLRFYAELFLGDARLALRDYASARECFARAAALYPRAQSARLALSLVARRTGDRAAALQEIEKPLSRWSDDGVDADPWWTYRYWQLRGSAELLAELRLWFTVASR
jgi:tetratricopeptide (TPR) repeat protein